MKHGAYVLLSPDRKLRAAHLFALRKNSICIVTYRPSAVGGLGNSIPSSLRRELRLSTLVVLPLGAGMRSSVNSNVFAVGDINVDVPLKLLRRIFREWLGNIDSRIVDEQVNASEMARGRLNHL